MKTQSNSSVAQMSSEHMYETTKEVLAAGFCQAKTKIFTAVDLWNIQRQGKSRIQRRFSF
ncbi:MAG: hypothetical protein JWP81_1343 [Ferruginibacter sp.]|nr:hypothetical protein [Ferruginibacter sp.]